MSRPEAIPDGNAVAPFDRALAALCAPLAPLDGLILAWPVNPDRMDFAARIPRIIDILWDGLGAARTDLESA
ncbi:MAG: hypothetical protein HZC24_09100 [Rhodocyclales bacterium]|nr:hypothetical protein [Rhodocyclales bacterium]